MGHNPYQFEIENYAFLVLVGISTKRRVKELTKIMNLQEAVSRWAGLKLVM